MPNFADYIFNRALNLGLPGVYVGIINNLTTTPYKTGPSGSDGLYTFSSNPPAGSYTVYTSPTGSGLPPGGDWVGTGETNYVVAPASPVANTDLAGPLLNALTAGSNLSVGAAPGGVGAQSVALINNPTLTGLLTAQAGLTLTGLLTMLDAASRIVPGATSLSLRNNANNADNLILTDAGLATLRNALTILAGGATVTGVVSGSLGINDGRGVSGANVPCLIDQQSPSGIGAFTFASPLPTGFKHLWIDWQARTDAAVVNSAVKLTVNNDSAANYYNQFLQGNNATTSAGATGADNYFYCGDAAGTSGTAGYPSGGSIRIPSYGGAAFAKLFLANYGLFRTTAAADFFTIHRTAFWKTVGTPVTRIDIGLANGNFVAGSIFSLYAE